MATSGYVLGNFANEVERLGFQHQLLADGFHALWQRGGIIAGEHVIDAGCGPGFASLELAKIVGDAGKVTAMDFTPKYLNYLRTQVAEEAIKNISLIEGDLHNIPLPEASCDAIFVKFVLLFIPDLHVVLSEFKRVLRPGGRLLISDYGRSGRFAPLNTPLNDYLDFLVKHYEGRSNIEVGLALPPALVAQGFQLTTIDPEVRIGRLGDRVWQWTEMFIKSSLTQLVTDGDLSKAKADHYRTELARLATDPAACYCSPLVLHFVATKPI